MIFNEFFGFDKGEVRAALGADGRAVAVAGQVAGVGQQLLRAGQLDLVRLAQEAAVAADDVGELGVARVVNVERGMKQARRTLAVSIADGDPAMRGSLRACGWWRHHRIKVFLCLRPTLRGRLLS